MVTIKEALAPLILFICGRDEDLYQKMEVNISKKADIFLPHSFRIVFQLCNSYYLATLALTKSDAVIIADSADNEENALYLLLRTTVVKRYAVPVLG
jgi:hypothetical protein